VSGDTSEVCEEITSLGWEKHQLLLRDVAVAVRCADGTLTLDGEPLPVGTTFWSATASWFLAGLALAVPPLTGGIAARYLDRTHMAADAAGISDDFVREVADLIKPGTSVLFVLDEGGDMDAILDAIRGLGGTVLKTNVDLERARLIQSTLAARADTTQPDGP
jgi:uncharacterized membrane protein